jgi:arylsulfatase A-like enzyme
VNGDLRGGKHDIWEGGFRVPFIVRWPGRVQPATVSGEVICLTDILATVAGLLDVPLKPGQAEDSFDIGEAMFSDKPSQPVRDHVILQDANATYAIRRGEWKLVERTTTPAIEPRNRNAASRNARKRPADVRDELFNLADDPAETRDVSESHSDLVKQLRDELISARDSGFTRPDAGK